MADVSLIVAIFTLQWWAKIQRTELDIHEYVDMGHQFFSDGTQIRKEIFSDERSMQMQTKSLFSDETKISEEIDSDVKDNTNDETIRKHLPPITSQQSSYSKIQILEGRI